MKFILGIGNPGAQYRYTRHNVGFRAVDAVKKASKESSKKVELLKPSTFVNKSGDAVRSLMAKRGFEEQALLVICDDVNLDFGKLRLRGAGSAGGHHGLESIIEALGSTEFPRLRVGVRRAEMPADLSGFVLEDFSSEEEKELKNILEKVVLICDSWVKEGLSAAINQLSRLQSVKQK